ncbi:MAG: DNA-processing protein DprA [Steroidobacteraceae bacterium]
MLAGLASPADLPEPLIDADLRWLDASGAALIPCTSPDYPPLLARLPAAPAVLYVLGRTAALATRQIAMVGARNATPGGRAIARGFAMAFARAGVTVTSGLALGIDGASHEGALAADGATIAVCAHGLDEVYPREHAGLAARIREHGALVSRFPPGTPPRRRQFPARNRILSGMAHATLVVEAAQGSGSLLTAHSAVQQGRPLFAVPGSVASPLSRGCHQLLREGASLAEDASAVLEELGIPEYAQPLASDATRTSNAAQSSAPLDKDSEILLDALGFEPVSVSSLMERTGLPVSSIASILLSLELRGRVAPHPGGRYCRLS